MLFDVVAMRDGREVVWKYETDGSNVWDENGTEMVPERVLPEYTSTALPFTKDRNPNKKSRENELLEIMLGGKCNFNCPYCSQLPIRDKIYSGKPSDVPGFIKMLRDSGLKSTRIQLWGGEPLVYWKVLKALIPPLRECQPQAKIQIVSNGSLFDIEKAKFFVEHDIFYWMSHDGPGQAVRGEDYLDNPKIREAIEYMAKNRPGRVGFGATPSRGNLDAERIVRFFERKGVPYNFVCVHNIVRCHIPSKAQIDACDLTEEERDQYSDSIFNLLNGGHNEDVSVGHRCAHIARTILAKASLDTVRTECNLPYSNGLLVNLKGDVYTCHNHAVPGTWQGNLADLDSVEATGYTHWRFRKECRECPYIHSCKGGCPSSGEEARKHACPNLRALNKGLYRAAFAGLFGIYVKEFRKHGEA